MPDDQRAAQSKKAIPKPGSGGFAILQEKVTEVYQERLAAAMQRYADTIGAAGNAWLEAGAHPASPIDLWRDASTYWLDFAQRSVLFWDTLRQRGNNWIEHEKAGKPPLLHFQWEMIADARTFDKPVNYALVQIIPPEGIETDPALRPFVVIDPRAGHGPGIGGFKQDSQVGVALKAGHPVYFVIFFPEPMPGQTLADVSRAEVEFLRIIRNRHSKTGKPVIIGNCQGGWAAMLVGTLDPDLPGPFVINGAPMSYWAGNDGENPMRYAGGILGGTWPALMSSDLGAGLFDGAYLVDNFEYLNPANTFFAKYYTLFSNIDSEPPRFLEFERWWGGYFLMDRAEIQWIVENLFVGNKLAAGTAEWSTGQAFDLRAIRSPIIVFASLGDNITPPQQAFNWVADLYPTTEALKANGQVIIGLMHESVGHLGIFVSGKIAKREHTQIVDLLPYVEALPPGLYGMRIEEIEGEDGETRFDVVLTERRVEELHALQKYGRIDEKPFDTVRAASDINANIYETFVHPFLTPLVSPAAAKMMRTLHPQRVQRWAVSDLNPLLRPLGGLAEFVAANRVTRNDDGLMVSAERLAAAMTTASWDLFRDLRDASVENLFFRTYAPMTLAEAAHREEAAPAELIGTAMPAPIQEALTRIEEGGPAEAVIRIALLLIKAGTGRRRLSGIKEIRDMVKNLIGKERDYRSVPADAVRAIIREQSYIVDYEPQRALAALPKLLRIREDRHKILEVLDHLAARLPGKPESTPRQLELLDEFKRLIGPERRFPVPPVQEHPVRATKH